MRTKPRLTLTPYYCDNPECPAPRALRLGYYPKRESVRHKMSPFRYCSTRCQRQHWEARRRAGRLAAKRPYPCAGPSCPMRSGPRSGPGARPPTATPMQEERCTQPSLSRAGECGRQGQSRRQGGRGPCP